MLCILLNNKDLIGFDLILFDFIPCTVACFRNEFNLIWGWGVGDRVHFRAAEPGTVLIAGVQF